MYSTATIERSDSNRKGRVPEAEGEFQGEALAGDMTLDEALDSSEETAMNRGAQPLLALLRRAVQQPAGRRLLADEAAKVRASPPAPSFRAQPGRICPSCAHAPRARRSPPSRGGTPRSFGAGLAPPRAGA